MPFFPTDADFGDIRRQLRPFDATRPGECRIGDRWYWNFSSNDYLNLAHSSELKDAALALCDGEPFGSTGSRLLGGDQPLFGQLEDELAAWIGSEASLLFNSGYTMNVGLLSSILGPKDGVFLDRYCHASMVDGLRLSGAGFHRFRHGDVGHLADLLATHRSKYDRVIILTESVFSMDGDVSPLTEIVRLKRQYDALLMVDEAHALGVFGPQGRGVVAALDLVPDVDLLVGTFGKAFGSSGAFVACTERMRDFLINSARSFIYSTALPSIVTAWNLSVLRQADTVFSGGEVLLGRAAHFRDALREGGFDVLGESPIVPVVLGDADQAVRLSDRLREAGFMVTAIRPPTVPKDACRCRFSLSLAHTDEVLNSLVLELCRGL